MNIEDKKKGADNDIIKTDSIKKEKKEEKKSVSDEFMEELDEQEKEIFLKLKSILIDECELLEFEAVNEDNLDDFAALITYIKNDVITIKDDGVQVKLRRPIINSNDEILTNNVTILFERNESRERAFTKNIKISKKNIESQKEFTRASLAASFKNIDFNGTSKILSTNNTKGIHNKDYMLLLTCYNFFRN
jgi:hypothetical protein